LVIVTFCALSSLIFWGTAVVVKAAGGRRPPDPPSLVLELALIRNAGRHAI
jgi:hypothetical protein